MTPFAGRCCASLTAIAICAVLALVPIYIWAPALLFTILVVIWIP